MDAILGRIYEDLSTPAPRMLYKWAGGELGYVSWMNKNDGHDQITREDLLACDVNHDGYINAIDASLCLKFYAIMSSPSSKEAFFPASLINDPNATYRDFFAEYIKKVCGFEEVEQPGFKVIRKTDDDGSYVPGLNIDINEYQGLTTILNGDIQKSVSVKLFDTSAGCDMDAVDARYKRGGLRFTTGGYVSVRINNSSAYNATTPKGRGDSDLNQPKEGDVLLENGSKGLMIYSDNVLGIQLDTKGSSDNGQLAIDEDGSLRISPNYSGGGGGGEYLTITDSASHSVQYNGSTAINITLGPGLMLEDDPQQGE